MKKCLIVCVALIITLTATWWFSPEQVIKRRCVSLFKVLTIDLTKLPTARAMAVYSLHPFLAPEVAVSTPNPEEAHGIFAREELESAFSSICQHALLCCFSGLTIDDVKIQGKRASVKLTLQANLEFPEMRIADGPYRVRLDWQRGEKNWLLERAEGQPMQIGVGH